MLIHLITYFRHHQTSTMPLLLTTDFPHLSLKENLCFLLIQVETNSQKQA